MEKQKSVKFSLCVASVLNHTQGGPVHSGTYIPGEGGWPLPLPKHALVLHVTISADFEVSQLEQARARERQTTNSARL